jgi:hypothetical protein
MTSWQQSLWICNIPMDKSYSWYAVCCSHTIHAHKNHTTVIRGVMEKIEVTSGYPWPSDTVRGQVKRDPRDSWGSSVWGVTWGSSSVIRRTDSVPAHSASRMHTGCIKGRSTSPSPRSSCPGHNAQMSVTNTHRDRHHVCFNIEVIYECMEALEMCSWHQKTESRCV